MTFISATIQANSNIRLVPYNKLAALVGSSLGCEGDIKNIKLNQLASTGHWLLTCFFHNICEDPVLVARRETTPIRSLYSRDASTTSTTTTKDAETVESDTNGDDDNDNDDGKDDDRCSTGYSTTSSYVRAPRNVPWREIEDQQLLAYRRENKPWDWIFQKFPNRSKAAVRMRASKILRRSK
jgi:hypothetical protein